MGPTVGVRALSTATYAEVYTERMSVGRETTIRVPVVLRERIKAEAAKRGVNQAQLVEIALRELDQAEFLRSVEAVDWDDEAEDEAREWDAADLSGDLDPWEPSA